MESAYLFVIPRGDRESEIKFDTVDSSVVVFPSQSFLYESLCLIKDLKWLNEGKEELPDHLRLTHLPRLPGFLPGASNESYVIREIFKQNLSRLYGIPSLSNTVLEAVLSDEFTVSLRDLPAFLACGNSLLYKLKSGINNHSGNEENFNKFVCELVSNTEL
jgi:hypothetical protein